MITFDEASSAFLSWLRNSGAGISEKIALKDLRHIEAGRGIIARQDIEENELLFSIPRSTILSVENSILSHEIPTATFEHLGPWLSLILVMLYEYKNGSSSSWAPYFGVLPSDFNTLMFWSEDELEGLQASAVRNKIGKTSADDMFTNQLVPVIKEFSSVFFSGDQQTKEKAEEMDSPQNLMLMHRMGSLIMAYAFDVEPADSKKDIDEEGYVSEDEDEALPKGMVPMADMLNADADRNNARLFYEETHLSMKALKPIKAGEEIFNDYGPLPRADLLRRYGYITDNYAQYDVVELPFELIKTSTIASGIYSEERLQYLDEQGIVESGYDISASNPFDLQESLSPELIILVETLLLDAADFDRLRRKGKLPKPEKMTLQTATFIHKLVQVRILEYPTSLEEDVRNFSVPPPGTCTSKERRYAMAKTVRLGEKKILKNAEELLGQLTRDGAASKRPIDGADSGPDKKQRTE